MFYLSLKFQTLSSVFTWLCLTLISKKNILKVIYIDKSFLFVKLYILHERIFIIF